MAFGRQTWYALLHYIPIEYRIFCSEKVWRFSLSASISGRIYLDVCVCASAQINQSQGRALRLCCAAVICPTPRPSTFHLPRSSATFVTFEVEINSKMEIKRHSARAKRKMLRVRGEIEWLALAWLKSCNFGGHLGFFQQPSPIVPLLARRMRHT